MTTNLMTTKELDLAVGLIIEAHGNGLTREAFDDVSKDLAPTLGLRDRLWARYLLARGGSSYQPA